MSYDITAALNIEIKKEMADRYFSFRKLIEEDSAALNKAVNDAVILEQKVAIAISRIYILLQDEQLIETFLELSGLSNNYYFDEHILTSPTIRARLFEDISVWGLTWKGRFTKIFLTCYDHLCRHIEDFRVMRAELSEEQEIIGHTIDAFYRQNDISSMLGFFRSMESGAQLGSSMEGGLNTGFDDSIEQKMRIKPPHIVDEGIDPLPPLVPAEQIKAKLKALAKEAITYHPEDFTQ